MKKIISLILVFALSLSVFAMSGCTKKSELTSDSGNSVGLNSDNKSDKDSNNNTDKNNNSDDNIPEDASNPVAKITVKDFGTMTVELYYEKAPNTVKNFISLANSGYYNGLTFHRIYSGFMIQGGCPLGTGTGDPGYSIKGEFSSNGFSQNDIKHERGVISMARSGHPDSAGSQFFIMHQDASHLDGLYAAFGKVINGLDILDAIASVDVQYNMGGEKSDPIKDVVIESITVETFSIDYGEPEKV